jgi:hypothetical protein
VWLERLPGTDLETLNDEGALEEGALYAAGLEFRRVHGLFSPYFWELAESRLVIPTLSAGCGGASVPSMRRLGACVDASPCCAKAWSPTGHHALPLTFKTKIRGLCLVAEVTLPR